MVSYQLWTLFLLCQLNNFNGVRREESSIFRNFWLIYQVLWSFMKDYLILERNAMVVQNAHVFQPNTLSLMFKRSYLLTLSPWILPFLMFKRSYLLTLHPWILPFLTYSIKGVIFSSVRTKVFIFCWHHSKSPFRNTLKGASTIKGFHKWTFLGVPLPYKLLVHTILFKSKITGVSRQSRANCCF